MEIEEILSVQSIQAHLFFSPNVVSECKVLVSPVSFVCAPSQKLKTYFYFDISPLSDSIQLYSAWLKRQNVRSTHRWTKWNAGDGIPAMIPQPHQVKL